MDGAVVVADIGGETIEEDKVECPRCGGKGFVRRSDEGGWVFDPQFLIKVYPKKGEPNDEFECHKCGGTGHTFMTPILQFDGSYVHPRHEEYWDSEEGRKHLKKEVKKRKKEQYGM